MNESVKKKGTKACVANSCDKKILLVKKSSQN
jgi:hypothetical protein